VATSFDPGGPRDERPQGLSRDPEVHGDWPLVQTRGYDPAMGRSPLSPHSATAAELKERIAAERGGAPFLVYRDGEAVQRIVVLDEPASRLWVGRAADADIALAWDTEVSRVHAELERVAGSWTVVDDGMSRNGTFVNGERLSGRRRLSDGDVLRVGDTAVVYRSPLDAESSVTSASERAALAAGVPDAQRRVLIALCRPFKNSGAFASPATNQRIAEELFLSVSAVKTHLRSLFTRFGIEDLPQNQKRLRLVEIGFETGLVGEHDL
jgi:pSer/pThr/pTyr-binding forkhead associated (FHA) protein